MTITSKAFTTSILYNTPDLTYLLSLAVAWRILNPYRCVKLHKTPRICRNVKSAFPKEKDYFYCEKVLNEQIHIVCQLAVVIS